MVIFVYKVHNFSGWYLTGNIILRVSQFDTSTQTWSVYEFVVKIAASQVNWCVISEKVKYLEYLNDNNLLGEPFLVL